MKANVPSPKSQKSKVFSSLWKCIALLIPTVTSFATVAHADSWTNLVARYKSEPDMYRREAIIREANANSVVVSVTTQTVVTARDAKLAQREAIYLAKLSAAGLSITNDFDAATDDLDANVNSVAGLKLAVRLSTLRARIMELGGDPKAATGATAVTNHVPVATYTTPFRAAGGTGNATEKDFQ